MSKITIRFCNKCEIELPQYINQPTIVDKYKNDREIDLCDKCYHEFCEFMGDKYNVKPGTAIEWDFRDIKKSSVEA